MDKETRNAIERATQKARKLLEGDFADQLDGVFDVHRSGAIAAKGGTHLIGRQPFDRERIVAAIEHKRAAGMSAAEAVADYLRDAAFTMLNRFVALKMLEARELVQECITNGEQSSGYREYCGLAPGLPLLKDSAGYRLYIECLFDELSTEVKVLFDRRDPSSVLWPKRATFEQLLDILNTSELAGVWGEDETIGWVYQYFNGQDERRKMREASQAPRNSRELAVRNQFFTPRYVVQFLTDNTLGRIWYEMRETNTVLADRCEYMVRKPDEQFAPRAKKDPRDLLVLDPACGSGHFLLYAFDLLVAIYEEAYADPDSLRSEATRGTLAEDYAGGIDTLRAAIPGLVLAHNLHGVDIDPRCAQIAQLALWMRAQRAYRDFGVARAERPLIRRSNIVVAEPLVADEQLVKEFVARLGDAQLAHVFLDLVTALKLAGDLGLLLRIETVARPAKEGQTADLFAPPEDKIRSALTLFITEEGNRASTRKRLFADDAAQGMGLLSVAEKRFDVVLMNPPFGAGSARAKNEFDKTYPRTKNDVYAAFIERGIELLSIHGRLGAITSRTGFFLSSFQKWREDIILATAPPTLIADLGYGVMDAALVEAAAYVLERRNAGGAAQTIVIRLLEETFDKPAALIKTITDSVASGDAKLFEVDSSKFSAIPLSPFAYWISEAIRHLFADHPTLHGEERIVASGASSNDDVRFIRAWWEVPIGDAHSRPFAKGGAYSPFYDDVHLRLRWKDDGAEIKAYVMQNRASKGWSPHWKAELHNPDLYFRPGLTWPRRTKSALSFRVLPTGCIFGDKGPGLFVKNDDSQYLLALLAICTSKIFAYLVEIQLAAADAKRGGAARSYEVGVLQRTPIPRLNLVERASLSEYARRIYAIARTRDTFVENSHAFVLPGASEDLEREVVECRLQIDELAFKLYSIGPSERATVEAHGSSKPIQNEDTDVSNDDEQDEQPGSGQFGAAREGFLTWLVGVTFCRFDPRLATGDRQLPAEPPPFEGLPERSPGMIPMGNEPLDRPDILVDDTGHAADFTVRMKRWADRLSIETPSDLRSWIAREFFSLHIKMYSKSRRKAPIYWQLATSLASYSVWLYIHAFTKDTLFRVQNDYVAPKLAHEERRLEELTNEAGEKGTGAQRKELSAQKDFVGELRAFLDEVQRVAPLWNPDLDDGVIINFAPLWRLVPQHKAWQKELKSTWNALCEGKYDWAHLAMYLWPERVVPKCATDRSLAIAHGLEDFFWVERNDGKWIAREKSTQSVEDLVRERTSPAVKAALKSLLDAPQPAGSGRKSKKG